MSSITFTQTSGGSATVTITAKIVYGTDFFDRRLNHQVVRTVDGGTQVYDVGPTEVHGTIVMKDVSYTDGANLLTWIRGSVVFDTYTFTISAITSVDLGLGKNTLIGTTSGATEDAFYDGGSSTSGVTQYVAPGQYNISFPYRFIR